MNRAVTLIAAALIVATPARATATKPIALPFIENDFDRALTAAKASSKPVFVEVWAPW